MKLSTAIRIGSMTTRHIISKFTDENNGRCAVGAALEAVNFKNWGYVNSVVLEDSFPLICQDDMALFRVITDLNDHRPVTREEIADCVERFENWVENGNKHSHETAVKSNKELVKI